VTFYLEEASQQKVLSETTHLVTRPIGQIDSLLHSLVRMV